MGSVGAKLKAAREAKGLTLEEVGNAVGVGKSTVRKWETGAIANMRRDKIAKLAEVLGISPAVIMGWTDETNVDSDAKRFGKFAEDFNKRRNARGGFLVPVLGRVAAGIPITAVQEVIDYEELPETMNDGSDYFGLRIKGDSMSPRICDGDVVIVRKQNDAESGDIVIALINGDDGVCKKLNKNQNGIALVSLNPNYEPMYFSKKEIETLPVNILGKVVELRAKF